MVLRKFIYLVLIVTCSFYSAYSCSKSDSGNDSGIGPALISLDPAEASPGDEVNLITETNCADCTGHARGMELLNLGPRPVLVPSRDEEVVEWRDLREVPVVVAPSCPDGMAENMMLQLYVKSGNAESNDLPLTLLCLAGDDAAMDAFPFDENEFVDTDGDGIGNNEDMDDDGDGVADFEDADPVDPAVTDSQENPPFIENFETGDLRRWSGIEGTYNSFAVNSESAHTGDYGLELTGETTGIYRELYEWRNYIIIDFWVYPLPGATIGFGIFDDEHNSEEFIAIDENVATIGGGVFDSTMEFNTWNNIRLAVNPEGTYRYYENGDLVNEWVNSPPNFIYVYLGVVAGGAASFDDILFEYSDFDGDDIGDLLDNDDDNDGFTD